MTDIAKSDEANVAHQNKIGIGSAVALALHHHRVSTGMTIGELARASGVSSPMISRIESVQVSPSLSTLEALASALSVPVISFFQHTIETADITFVKAGEGLQATRLAPDHLHSYRVLAYFANKTLKFSAARVTLHQKDNGTHPSYFANGYVFLTISEGVCCYSCGGETYRMEPGDSISFDAQLRHGVKSIETDSATFVSVTAYPS